MLPIISKLFYLCPWQLTLCIHPVWEHNCVHKLELGVVCSTGTRTRSCHRSKLSYLARSYDLFVLSGRLSLWFRRPGFSTVRFLRTNQTLAGEEPLDLALYAGNPVPILRDFGRNIDLKWLRRDAMTASSVHLERPNLNYQSLMNWAPRATETPFRRFNKKSVLTITCKPDVSKARRKTALIICCVRKPDLNSHTPLCNDGNVLKTVHLRSLFK